MIINCYSELSSVKTKKILLRRQKRHNLLKIYKFPLFIMLCEWLFCVLVEVWIFSNSIVTMFEQKFYCRFQLLVNI